MQRRSVQPSIEYRRNANRAGCCTARRVSPSQIGPWLFKRLASAQSSMISPLIASIPPEDTRALRRTSMHPPAAAAVFLRPLLTRENGNSMAKKNTKAGMRNRSAGLSQDSFAIRETSARLWASARRTSCERLSGECSMSASVSQKNSEALPSAAAMPWDNAHSLPVQPAVRGPPEITVIRADATSRTRPAVSSVL